MFHDLLAIPMKISLLFVGFTSIFADHVDIYPDFVPRLWVRATTLDSILICWSEPPPELKDRVHHYKVIAIHRNKTIGPLYLPNDTNSHIFDNLESEVTFQIKVAACTDYTTQCGDWSAPQNGTTVDPVAPVQGTMLWLSLAIAMLLVIVMSVWLGLQKYREKAARREFIEATLQRFNRGDLRALNTELDIGDQAELLPYNKKWEFPRELLTLGKILGSGAFGVVRKAEARSIRRREKFTIVAVKLVRATARLHCMTALTRELKILANLGKHLNIVNLFGACTKNVPYGELFVIVEFCRFGNLHDYLLSHRADFVDQFAGTCTDRVSADNAGDSGVGPVSGDRDSSTGNCGQRKDLIDKAETKNNALYYGNKVEPDEQSKYQGDYTDDNVEPICTQDLLCWSWQVTQGMRYLGSKKILHGDLAARNILLADHNVVKICDFGMARRLYLEDNYQKLGNEPLPMKWMAIESLRDRVFSIQSDIWSFGIVLWEFFTLAQTPYPGIDPAGLYQKLVDGFRMTQPKYATKDLYEMMLNCWDVEPSNRTSFEELGKSIAVLLDEGVQMHYIDLSRPLDEMNAEATKRGEMDYLTMTPAQLQSDTIELTIE